MSLPEPYYSEPGSFSLWLGDCLDVLGALPEGSVDAVVTDPPYGIGFMGKAWDGKDIEARVATRRRQAPMPDDGTAGLLGGYQSPAVYAGRYDRRVEASRAFQDWALAWAAAALRVAKPGAHLVAFGGTRTFHRLTCAIEDAGWEIRDCLMWLYGSGFPKSLDVSKALDREAGLERPRVPGGCGSPGMIATTGLKPGEAISREAISREAALWNGWGTALKPAWEPIIIARKPLDGTVAANVLKWGTGGLSVDGCRIPSGGEHMRGTVTTGRTRNSYGKQAASFVATDSPLGRWPANVCLDESAAAMLDAEVGDAGGGRYSLNAPGARTAVATTAMNYRAPNESGSVANYGDSGGPSRFFYTSKASRGEREEGCEDLPDVTGAEAVDRKEGSAGLDSPRAGAGRSRGKVKNLHPTVKPLDLMRWLCRLVTPPGGVILDPFMGSGTTGRAALMEGCQFVGIEREPEYMRIAEARIRRTPKGLPFAAGTREAEATEPGADDGQMGLAL